MILMGCKGFLRELEGIEATLALSSLRFLRGAHLAAIYFSLRNVTRVHFKLIYFLKLFAEIVLYS